MKVLVGGWDRPAVRCAIFGFCRLACFLLTLFGWWWWRDLLFCVKRVYHIGIVHIDDMLGQFVVAVHPIQQVFQHFIAVILLLAARRALRKTPPALSLAALASPW